MELIKLNKGYVGGGLEVWGGVGCGVGWGGITLCLEDPYYCIPAKQTRKKMVKISLVAQPPLTLSCLCDSSTV